METNIPLVTVPSNFPTSRLAIPLRAIATHHYAPRDFLELELTRDMRLNIYEAKGDWWYIARKMDGTEGWVPSAYVKLLQSVDALTMAAVYLAWKKCVDVALGFAPPPEGTRREKMKKETFPWLPPELCACEEMLCLMRKEEKGLRACVHDVERLLKGVGSAYGAKWLWRESLKWHPDMIAKKCKEHWREDGKNVAAEMFTIVSELANRERKKEKEKEAKDSEMAS